MLSERETDTLKRMDKDALISVILEWRDEAARLRAERDEARQRVIEAAARVERLGKALRDLDTLIDFSQPLDEPADAMVFADTALINRAFVAARAALGMAGGEGE